MQYKTYYKKTLLFFLLLMLTFVLFVGCAGEKTTAASIPHPIEGREECLSCHEQGIGGATKMPHEKREDCTKCHKPEE